MTVLELRNGRYYDDNENSWSDKLETEESARKKSESLTDCHDCSDCSDCYGCSYCRDCSDCNRCSYCSDCSNCSGCSGCSYCSDCSNCSGCSGCSGGYDCRYCRDCSGCHGCHDCYECYECSGCHGCRDFKANPESFRRTGIGSRLGTTYLYWTQDKIQVVCGCFHGTIDEFENRVNSVHGNNTYGQAYHKLIELMRQLTENDHGTQELADPTT